MTMRAVDVLVIGAGPAGLAAAAVAAERGHRVLLVDRQRRLGGQIWRHRDPAALPRTARALAARVAAAGVETWHEAHVIDAAAPRCLIIARPEGEEAVRAEAIVLATGARELLLPFPGWTLPGVTGVGGLQALLKEGLQLRDAKVIIAGSGPLILPVAAAVAASGARLLLVAEQASTSALRSFAASIWREPSKLLAALRYRIAFRRAPLYAGSWIARAEGDTRIRRATVQQGSRQVTLECDWLATGAGLVPHVELGALLGCRVEDDAIAVDSLQRTTVPGVFAAGECTGVKGDAAALAEGEIAGRIAVGDAAVTDDRALLARRDRGREFGRRLAAAFALRPEVTHLADRETIICRCEDVRLGSLRADWTQRQAKLWTRVGMGACQGAVCGPACQALFGWQRNSVRPPLGAPACGSWRRGLASLE